MQGRSYFSGAASKVKAEGKALTLRLGGIGGRGEESTAQPTTSKKGPESKKANISLEVAFLLSPTSPEASFGFSFQRSPGIMRGTQDYKAILAPLACGL